MGLFRKKTDLKNNLEFTEYNKIDKSRGLLTSFDLMEYFIMSERDDEEMFKLCDTIINGKAVLANFDRVNTNDCNYMLSFISGVVYARGGQAITLGPRLFLFAGKEELTDGSLLQYVEDIK